MVVVGAWRRGGAALSGPGVTAWHAPLTSEQLLLDNFQQRKPLVLIQSTVPVQKSLDSWHGAAGAAPLAQRMWSTQQKTAGGWAAAGRLLQVCFSLSQALLMCAAAGGLKAEGV